jgi:putative hydrolase of the HAD superfamily
VDATYDELGIGHYFAGYAISEVLGCRKPDPRMYAEGARLVGLAPHECLFVDDDPDLVAAARDLGYHGLALDRPAMTLDAVLPIVAGTR